MSLLDAVVSGLLEPGVYELDEGESAMEARLDRAGWSAHEVDLRSLSDRAAAAEAFASALSFPGWAGRNLDALSDAMRDLSWLPPAARVLVIDRPATNAQWWDKIRDVLLDAADHWMDSPTPMWVVVRR